MPGVTDRKRKSNVNDVAKKEKDAPKKAKESPSPPVGHVLTLGMGDVGQLGLGSDMVERKRATVVKELEGVDVVQVAAGGMHSVAVSLDGEVYTWGCNDDGALGRFTSGTDDEEYLPRKANLPPGVKIMSVSAGDSHTAALSDQGDVYAWGAYRDASGQIGLTAASISKKGEVTKIFPTTDAPDEKAVKVASGNDHTVILTSSGDIYTSGTGEQGQLGRLKECFGHRGGRRGLGYLLSPQIVRFRKKKYKFSDIFCGSFNTFALMRDEGSVYGWGLNNYGQLGSGNTDNCFNPEVMEALTSLREKSGNLLISGGQHHSIVADGDGKTYAFGRSDYGRLGLGEDAKETSVPVEIAGLSDRKVKKVACGECVSFALTEEGEVFSWGLGSCLQLGVGEEEDMEEPTLIKSKNINPDVDEVLGMDAGGQATILLARKRNAEANGDS